MKVPDAAIIEDSDYWRGIAGVSEHALPYKEWQHFIVFGDRWMFALNLNVDADGSGRVISILFADGWHGHVGRCGNPRIRPSRMDADFHFAGMRWTGGRYELWQLDEGVRLHVSLLPRSTPSVSHNIRLGEGTSLSWCLVPRLSASGWFERNGHRVRFEDCLAYHDHNWGHFRWGGDFSWEWGCAVSARPDSGWTAIFSRMNDRARHRTSATTLFLVRDGVQFRYFRNDEVRFATEGALDTRPDGRIPPAAALLLPEADRDVPRLTRIEARKGEDHLQCEVEALARGQVLVPAEGDLRRIVRLNEVHTRANVAGRCGGIPVHLEGFGLLEVVCG